MNDKEKQYKQYIREKYEKYGIKSLDESEILSLLLSYTSVKDCKTASDKLLQNFGSINSVFSGDISHLTCDGEIDNKSAIILKMIPELSRLYTQSGEKIKYLRNIGEAKQYFDSFYTGITEERICIVSVNTDMKIIDVYSSSSGMSDSVNADIRKITDNAIKSKAYGIFIAHNHPMSSSQPSASDYAITGEIIKAMRLYDIKVFDHIVVGLTSAVSMKDADTIEFDETE
ncbi:MAG: hypothetical protein J6K77_03590 [Ruminococcus sp.]|nr:hypothetical protein [Ruminococcus sp.]